MQELVGRLTALDPEASDTLKVVSYFDTLVAGGVGIETLLRGAAVLTGTIAGRAIEGRASTRIAPDGERVESGRDAEASVWPSRRTSDGSRIWIEREGAAHANDAMVLERLALAVAITSARRANTADAAVEVVVSASAAPAERAVAFHPDAAALVPGPNAVVATSRGLARVVLVDRAIDVPSGIVAGIGIDGPAERLPESWASALVALRLSTERQPVVDAAELGAVLLVAEAADRRGEPHPDATALAALDARSREVLEAVADAGSMRAAASVLGMHHSSVQARADAITAQLGYDPRTPTGRTRYFLARALAALARPGLG